jgi:hypothetical protein
MSTAESLICVAGALWIRSVGGPMPTFQGPVEMVGSAPVQPELCLGSDL